MKGPHIALAFVALVAAIFGAKYFLRPQPQKNALQARALATRVLGGHLAATQPGRRVVVMSSPYTRRAGIDRAIVETEEAGLRGLREGLGQKLSISAVALPELRPSALEDPRAIPIDTETTTPLSYLVAPGAFDAVVRQQPGCDIIVSLIGLPAELNRCEAWQAAGAPAFALLLPDLRMVGDTAAVTAAVKSGKLLAFVARKPGGPGDDVPLGREEKAEFARRFLLVTRENIDQVAQAYPGLF
jgi:hypothetical protein